MTIKALRKHLEQYDQRTPVRLLLYNDTMTILYLKDLEPEDLQLETDGEGAVFLGIDGEIQESEGLTDAN